MERKFRFHIESDPNSGWYINITLKNFIPVTDKDTENYEYNVFEAAFSGPIDLNYTFFKEKFHRYKGKEILTSIVEEIEMTTRLRQLLSSDYDMAINLIVAKYKDKIIEHEPE